MFQKGLNFGWVSYLDQGKFVLTYLTNVKYFTDGVKMSEGLSWSFLKIIFVFGTSRKG